MNKELIEGIKDNLDVSAIVKAFETFRDEVQLVSDRAEEMIVDLDFESSLDAKRHYKFKQDELVILSGVEVNPSNKKITFSAIYEGAYKYFQTDEAELIAVKTRLENGTVEKMNLRDHIGLAFKSAFTDELKIGSVVALQALVNNNPGLINILNDPDTFLNNVKNKNARNKAYAGLKDFGLY